MHAKNVSEANQIYCSLQCLSEGLFNEYYINRGNAGKVPPSPLHRIIGWSRRWVNVGEAWAMICVGTGLTLCALRGKTPEWTELSLRRWPRRTRWRFPSVHWEFIDSEWPPAIVFVSVCVHVCCILVTKCTRGPSPFAARHVGSTLKGEGQFHK